MTTLLILMFSIQAFSQAGNKPPGWQQPEYEREVDAYERKRDAEYQEERVLDIVGVRPGMVIGEVGAGNGYFALKLERDGNIYETDSVLR